VERLFNRNSIEEFTAVNHLSLHIKQGQKVAIMGRNGSGKTTLLKLICEISHPTTGKVSHSGKIVSLIDLEAGFHPEMTGYENIYLNGTVVGMDRKEIRQKIDQIIEFAGIGKFIDSPVYTYSSGMMLRLGFSIAVHADPDILILDEMLAAGDIDFQKKSVKKIQQFFQQNKTVITVSHNLEFLEKHYDRFIWMNKGKIIDDGGKEIVKKYLKSKI